MDHAARKYWIPSGDYRSLQCGAEGDLDDDARTRAMRIDVAGVGFRLADGVATRVSTRVLLALSRFGPHLRRVTVRLAEGPKLLGGVDRHCRMRAWLQPPAQVFAEAIDGTVEAAVARAAEQLAKRIAGVLLVGRPIDGHPGLLSDPARVDRRRVPPPAPAPQRRRPRRARRPAASG